MHQRVLSTFESNTYLAEGSNPSDPLPDDIGYHPGQLAELCSRKPSKSICKSCSVNKTRGNRFAILLKNLKVKIIIQETTDSFKTMGGSNYN
jgi:hypothetical protein